MAETATTIIQSPATLWVTGFAPTGHKVSFTFALDPADQIGSAIKLLARLPELPLSAREEHLEPGEYTENIGWVCRTAKDDGTPIILFYVDNEAMEHSIVKLYIDNDVQRRMFEEASGKKLTELPIYEGTGNPQRNTRTGDYVIVRVEPSFRIVIKDNPKYEDGGKKPKRLFVRFADVAMPQPDDDEPKSEPLPKAAGAEGDDPPARTDARTKLGNDQRHKLPTGDRKPKADKETTTFECSAVNIIERMDGENGEGGGRKYRFEGPGIRAESYSRQPLRDAGIANDAIPDATGPWILPYPIRVTAAATDKDGKRYWNAVSAEAVK